MLSGYSQIFELSELLRRKEISSVELCQEHFQRIERNTELNAFITLDEENALRAAEAIDRRRQKSTLGPLAGIPLAHKDIFCTEGILTSCGSKILSNFIAPYDATIVKKLKNSQMIMLGKTNMDEFAMGSSTEHSYYGPVRNPWKPSKVPGGSSGGSAAAVAAGLAPAATATDTGGSIRQPAAFCGVTGIKPSYGRASRYGMVAFASSLDQAGIIARSAKDAAMVIDAMCGYDPKDSTSLKISYPSCFEDLEKPLNQLKIGIPRQYFTTGLDPSVSDIIMRALSEFESIGAQLVDIELPNSSAAIPCYYVIAPAEASSNLSRFDGVRYGYRSDNYTDLQDMYKTTRSEGFGAEVRRRIMIGTYVLSHGYYDAFYLKALKVRRLISDDFKQAFEQCDVIMGPTSPTTAFSIGSKVNDPVLMYLNDIYTAAVNLAGLPGMSIPAGLDNAGLPVGLHIVAPYLQDSLLLQTAHKYQTHTDYHLLNPGIAS